MGIIILSFDENIMSRKVTVMNVVNSLLQQIVSDLEENLNILLWTIRYNRKLVPKQNDQIFHNTLKQLMHSLTTRSCLPHIMEAYTELYSPDELLLSLAISGGGWLLLLLLLHGAVDDDEVLPVE